MRNVPPAIAGDLNLTVKRGQSVRITLEDLTAIDPDSPAQSLAFAVSSATNGFVARASAASTPVDGSRRPSCRATACCRARRLGRPHRTVRRDRDRRCRRHVRRRPDGECRGVLSGFRLVRKEIRPADGGPFQWQAMASKASGLRRLVLGRNLASGRLGQQRLGLASPILFLDLAAELQRLVDVGDVVVGERRDLVEAGDVEPRRLRPSSSGVTPLICFRSSAWPFGFLKPLKPAARRLARASERSTIRAALPRRPRR